MISTTTNESIKQDDIRLQQEEHKELEYNQIMKIKHVPKVNNFWI